MIFINTRPKNRAQPLTTAMQDKGLTVYNLPLLELLPVPISEVEQQYQQNFCHQLSISDFEKCSVADEQSVVNENPYQALVVVSPTAAQMGLAACPTDFIPDCNIIAVGHKTADVLRQAGWQVHCPEEYSNEGMMRMSALSTLGAGDKVLIWRGEGGRRLLVNHLQQHGVKVDAISWYRRQCPEDAVQNFKKIQAALSLSQSSPQSFPTSQLPQKPAQYGEYDTSSWQIAKPTVLVSSGEAFRHWCRLVNETQSGLESEPESELKLQYKLTDFQYLTFGKRLTAILKAQQLPCQRIAHLDVAEVWRGIKRLNLSPK